jgi:hypothetical protein
MSSRHRRRRHQWHISRSLRAAVPPPRTVWEGGEGGGHITHREGERGRGRQAYQTVALCALYPLVVVASAAGRWIDQGSDPPLPSPATVGRGGGGCYLEVKESEGGLERYTKR